LENASRKLELERQARQINIDSLKAELELRKQAIETEVTNCIRIREQVMRERQQRFEHEMARRRFEAEQQQREFENKLRLQQIEEDRRIQDLQRKQEEERERRLRKCDSDSEDEIVYYIPANYCQQYSRPMCQGLIVAEPPMQMSWQVSYSFSYSYSG